MPVPAIIGGILALVGGAGAGFLSVTQAIGSHPLLAYFLLLGFLLLDSGAGAFINGFAPEWQGIFGSLFTWVFGMLGLPIIFYSWQVFIIMAIFPLVAFALKASA